MKIKIKMKNMSEVYFHFHFNFYSCPTTPVVPSVCVKERKHNGDSQRFINTKALS